MSKPGDLIKREYSSFRGVDFSNRGDEVNLYRSPDALNVWKNYKNAKGRCIETRPDIELLSEYDDNIYGLFFYTYSNKKHKIIHCGNKLYDDDKIIYNNMNRRETNFFIYNDLLYIIDGKQYLVYDGTKINDVVGYIPITTIGMSPTGGGTTYQDVNMLSNYRKNAFVADGETKTYKLDVESFDSNKVVKAWINDVETTAFTTNPTNGTITFNTAPTKPGTSGQSNVIIQFSKDVSSYRKRIEECSLVEIFDNRVFFSGNANYKNFLWHSSLDDPTYISDLDYYPEGSSDSAIKALIPGNNAIWVIKESNQNNTTIYYHNPTIDDTLGKVYPSSHSSISIGCVSKGINFNDDIVFFSNRGLEAITGDITTEQVLKHRSTLVDSKLLNEEEYKNIKLVEWQGYLLVIAGKNVYLADSRALMVNNDHNEYEWFYWEFDNDIQIAHVNDDILYLGMNEKIFTLTKEDTNIESYWCTIEDEFGYPQYQKSTNKKGCTIDMEGKRIKILARTDSNRFEEVDEYINKKGYIVSKIKKKKWKSIQLKVTSTEPFEIFSITLEAYIGSYVKR